MIPLLNKERTATDNFQGQASDEDDFDEEEERMTI